MLLYEFARACTTVAGVAMLLSGCSGTVEVSWTESAFLEEIEQEIIAGASPSRGALVSRGVVRVSTGCTGTMLSNQHVLTARHCVRTWIGATNSYGNSMAPMQVTLEGNVSANDQTVTSGRVLEPNTSTLNSGDYALIELASPLDWNGENDNFYNPIYSGSDASLAGVSVFCVGYGNNTEANQTAGTLGAGFGTLRTASITIGAAAESTLTSNRTNGNVGAPGDSGGTCFLNNQVTGVQSTCEGPSWDENSNGQLEGREWTSINSCRHASPSAYRGWVNQQLLASVSVSFVHSPAQAQQIGTTVTYVNGSDSISSTNFTLTSAALRSGWINATVSEPPRTMCTRIKGRVPLVGTATFRGACLGDGLVSVVI